MTERGLLSDNDIDGQDEKAPHGPSDPQSENVGRVDDNTLDDLPS